MSLQKRVYEGPDPERLLLEVWNDHGTGAQISEPEQIRTGGVLGFFAKSSYRVEVIGAPRTTPARPAAPAATPPSAPLEPRPTPSASRSTSDALDALVEDAEDTFERSVPAYRSFDDVLATVASSLGDDPAEIEGAFGETSPTRTLIRPGAPSPTAATPTPARRAGDPRPPAETRPPLEPSLERPAASEPPAATPSEAPSATPWFTAPVSGTETFRRVAPRDDQSLEMLRAAGFPGPLLGLLETRGAEGLSLESAFTLLGEVPQLPQLPGSLLAVVGARDVALEAARRLAVQVDLRPNEVALAMRAGEGFSPISELGEVPADEVANPAARFAPDLFVTDEYSAAAFAPGWRRDRVGIVAVATDGSEEANDWARRVLRAVRATAVWVIMDGRTKTDDLAQLLTCLGGADALVLEHAGATITPAEPLALGVPVALIDGRPARAESWAQLVRTAYGRRRQSTLA